MLALVAFRNLWRNRRRTLMSLLVVGVGTAGLLLTGGFVRYSFEGLRDAIILGGLGHLEVMPSAERAGVTSTADRGSRPPGLSGWRELRARIEGRRQVRAASATIQFAGVATNGDRSAALVGVAIEPDRTRAMGIEVKVRGGAPLPDAEPTPGEDRVLLGLGLARALGAGAGDVVTIMSTTADGTLNALDVGVAGVFTTGFQDLDDRILQTHIATAQRLLGTENVTSLIVGLRKTDETREAEADLRTTLAGNAVPVAIVDWETRAPFYGQVRALYAGIFTFVGAVIAVLVALSNASTLLMSVFERVREFGTLLAIGTSRAQLAGLLLMEALWLAAIGGLAGGALGLALAVVINAIKIEMPPPPAAVDPMALSLSVAPGDVLWAIAFMVAVLGVAAIAPMLRILRLQIVDALGHV